MALDNEPIDAIAEAIVKAFLQDEPYVQDDPDRLRKRVIYYVSEALARNVEDFDKSKFRALCEGRK